ncbi:MAG: thioesterase family protein, partial [Pseudomonas neustonica]
VIDLATTYLREAFARDALVFEVGLMDLNKYGGDIIFRISKSGNGEQVALAKSGFVFYHFESSKVRPMPEDFRVRFPGVNSLEE